MAYKDFISELQKKLEEKKQELSMIRETNVKYHKTESDVLIGDYILLYQFKGLREQMCRFDCGQLYRMYEKGSWEIVWEQILSSIDSSRKFMELGVIDLIEKNEYGLLKDKLFIRPISCRTRSICTKLQIKN